MASLTAPNDVWVPYVVPHASPDLRVFCFPYAGAGASVYAGWANELPRTLQVCPVQLPGRETRIHEPRFRSLDLLVDAALTALVPHFDRPFALFGHSMGALIAYVISVRLARMGLPAPRHLFVSARRAPQLPSRESLREFDDAQLCDRLRELGGIPPEVLASPELMALLLPILKDDFALTESGHDTGDALLTCPISAFGGIDDREVSRADLDGWRERTTGRYRLRLLPGDHFFLKSSRGLLQQLIVRELDAECA